MANRKKHGDCDLVTLGEFEQLLECNRKRRQIICSRAAITILAPCGQKMIEKQQLINMYEDCLVDRDKSRGQPRGFGDMQTVSVKKLKLKWRIDRSKLNQLRRDKGLRLFNFYGSERVLMMDLKLILDKQVKLNKVRND